MVSPESAPSRPCGWRLLSAYSPHLPTRFPAGCLFSRPHVGDSSSLHHRCRGGAGRRAYSSAREAGSRLFPAPLFQKSGRTGRSCAFGAYYPLLEPRSTAPLTPHLTSTDAFNTLPRNPKFTAGRASSCVRIWRRTSPPSARVSPAAASRNHFLPRGVWLGSSIPPSPVTPRPPLQG